MSWKEEQLFSSSVEESFLFKKKWDEVFKEFDSFDFPTSEL